MVHHRQAPVGGEHTQAMRHVVERRVELVGDRGHAFGRNERLDINLMKAERNSPQPHEKKSIEQGEADVVAGSVQQQPQGHRAAGQQDLPLGDPWSAIGSAGARRGVGDGYRRAQHMGDRVVAADKSNWFSVLIAVINAAAPAHTAPASMGTGFSNSESTNAA